MHENLNANELIQKLNEQLVEYKNYSKEIEQSLQEQETILKETISKFQPIYEWYSEQGLVFTHPTIKLRSGTGPILGFDNEKDEVIVFNVKKKRLEKVYLHDNENRKIYQYFRLIRDGYFEDAISGLHYLEKMMEDYVQRNQVSLEKLKQELNSL